MVIPHRKHWGNGGSTGRGQEFCPELGFNGYCHLAMSLQSGHPDPDIHALSVVLTAPSSITAKTEISFVCDPVRTMTMIKPNICKTWLNKKITKEKYNVKAQ